MEGKQETIPMESGNWVIKAELASFGDFPLPWGLFCHETSVSASETVRSQCPLYGADTRVLAIQVDDEEASYVSKNLESAIRQGLWGSHFGLCDHRHRLRHGLLRGEPEVQPSLFTCSLLCRHGGIDSGIA